MQENDPKVSATVGSRNDQAVGRQLSAHNQVMRRVAQSLTRQIALAANIVLDTLTSGGKVVFFGSGGSAACAQYWASLLLGRYNLERSGLPAIAVTPDTVVLTSIGNEYGYHEIFARQVEALVRANDVVVGICPSGFSTNVLAGVRAARARGVRTIGLTGGDGGQLATMVDQAVVVPSTEIPRIHEAHIIIAHIVCQLLEDRLLELSNEEAVRGRHFLLSN